MRRARPSRWRGVSRVPAVTIQIFFSVKVLPIWPANELHWGYCEVDQQQRHRRGVQGRCWMRGGQNRDHRVRQLPPKPAAVSRSRRQVPQGCCLGRSVIFFICRLVHHYLLIIGSRYYLRAIVSSKSDLILMLQIWARAQIRSSSQ